MGVYRNRNPKGVHVQIGVQCRTGSRVPTAPTAAPTFRVYFEDGTLVASGSLPPTERYQTAGLHQYMLFLGTAFSTAGRYYVRYAYAISGTNYVDMDSFEVLANGATGGMVNSIYFLDRPDSDWIVATTDSGGTPINRGPRI